MLRHQSVGRLTQHSLCHLLFLYLPHCTWCRIRIHLRLSVVCYCLLYHLAQVLGIVVLHDLRALLDGLVRLLKVVAAEQEGRRGEEQRTG